MTTANTSPVFRKVEVVDRYHYLQLRKIFRGYSVNCPKLLRQRQPRLDYPHFRNIGLRSCRSCPNHRGEEEGKVHCLTDIRWRWTDEILEK